MLEAPLPRTVLLKKERPIKVLYVNFVSVLV
jgi:hypothetical protein